MNEKAAAVHALQRLWIKCWNFCSLCAPHLILYKLHGVIDCCPFCFEANLRTIENTMQRGKLIIKFTHSGQSPTISQQGVGSKTHRFTVSTGCAGGINVQVDWLCAIFVLQVQQLRNDQLRHCWDKLRQKQRSL